MYTTGTITGNGTYQLLPSNGSLQNFSVTGTYGTATVTIEGSLQDDNSYATADRWAPVAFFSSADTYVKNGRLNAGCHFRAVVANAVGTTIVIDQN